ncbi:MAG: hypothetical protein IT576_15740 [Verrucomicrobiales bacterium]|nr:hypothetical protein [Verrucomicrobiales bacterium]
MSIPPVFSTLLRASALACAACALAATQPAVAQETVLYDIDFSAPTHTLDTKPATGTGVDRVSTVVFGSPTVVSEVGPLTDRPLVFRGRSTYEQIRLDIGTVASGYRVEFDVATRNLKSSGYSFTFLVDPPNYRQIYFHGTDNTLNFHPSPHPGATTHHWHEETLVHFTVILDYSNQRWTVWKDGALAFEDSIGETTLSSLRFSLSPAIGRIGDNLAVAVALDNVVVLAGNAGVLSPPTRLTATEDGLMGGIRLSWPASISALSYRVYRNEPDDFSTAALLAETDNLFHLDSSAIPERRYFYWVTSMRSGESSEASAPASTVRSQGPGSAFDATQGVYFSRIDLRWKPVVGALEYEIYRGENEDFSLAVPISKLTDLTYRDSSVENGRNYFSWIVAATPDYRTDPVGPVAGLALEPQPDLVISAKGITAIGAGAISDTGAGQSLTTVAPDRNRAVSQVRVNAFGAKSDDVLIRGSRGDRNLSVSYKYRGNATSQVISGRLLIPSTASTRELEVAVEPTPRLRRARQRASKSIQVTGISAQSQSRRDTVIFDVMSLPVTGWTRPDPGDRL